MHRRREFLRTGLLGAGVLALGPMFWRDALAATPATVGPGPYGPPGPPDPNGIMLPEGFSSRVIARGQVPVENTTYVWHTFPDGQATFATADGGFILVSNSEVPGAFGGGASAIRFGPDGTIRDAYRILADTNNNCSGGGTPWGTWLSCEETDTGRVWECDPEGVRPATVLPALGVFSHEAAAVDPGGMRVYLTEDNGEGALYRFTPTSYPELSTGLLEVATQGTGGVIGGGKLTWVRVPDPSAAAGPTRKQVPNSVRFRRGEGIWFDSGIVYVATTADDRVYAYDTRSETIELVYDGKKLTDPPLSEVDNITVSRQSGDLFVCEDSGGEDPLDIAIITPDRQVARFLKLTGPQHGSGEAISETTGVVFDPSGTRMFFSSQRGFGAGVIYEITGPFRLKRPPGSGGGGPKLTLGAQRSITTKTLFSRGLPANVGLGQAAKLDLRLRAPIGSRVGGGRRRQVTLARAAASRDVGGALLIPLRITKQGRKTLRGRRRTVAVLTVRATYPGGRTEVARQRVVVRVRPARRRGARPGS